MLQLDGRGPLYQQIYRAFREEILTRALTPGERVPSTRALADLLKVSRNTAVMAYEQLLAEGYLAARVGAAGTVVALALRPDSLSSNSSKSPGRQGHTLPSARGRLAMAGDSKSRPSSNQLHGVAHLDLGTNTATLTVRFPARPSGIRGCAVRTLVPVAWLACPPCQYAGPGLRPSARAVGAQGSHRRSPATPARNRCKSRESGDCQRNPASARFDQPGTIGPRRPRSH